MPGKTSQAARKYDSSRDRLNSANTRFVYGVNHYPTSIHIACVVRGAAGEFAFGRNGLKRSLQLKNGTWEEVVVVVGEREKTRGKAVTFQW